MLQILILDLVFDDCLCHCAIVVPFDIEELAEDPS